MTTIIKTYYPISILAVLLCLSIHDLQGQSIDREVLSSAGANLSNGNGSITFTMGEPMVQTFDKGMTLSQGFHQEWAVITAIGDHFDETYHVFIYPNPTAGQLTITSDGPAHVALFDLSGKAVFQTEKRAGAEKVDLGTLTPGLFVLVLMDEQGHRGTYKVEVIR